MLTTLAKNMLTGMLNAFPLSGLSSNELNMLSNKIQTEKIRRQKDKKKLKMRAIKANLQPQDQSFPF